MRITKGRLTTNASEFNLQIQLLQVLRLWVHRSPSFQLSKLLCCPVRDHRRVALRPLFVLYWVPILCGVVMPASSGKVRPCDVEHGRDGGCEDEAFEPRVLSGGLEDGDGTRDRRLNYDLGQD